jgi:hypothetical protein
MENPWSVMNRDLDSYILEMDVESVGTYSKLKRGQSEDFRLETSVAPEPWCGAVNSARVLVLSGNPHWDNRDWSTPPEVHEAMWANLSGDEPLYLLRPEFVDSRGSDWYRKLLLKDLLEVCDESKIRNGLCLVDFIGYRSHRWDQSLRLPSQKFTAFQVREAMKRGAVIVISRGRRPWTSLVPELETYGNLFSNSSAQNVRISPRNTSSVGFVKVVSALNH